MAQRCQASGLVLGRLPYQNLKPDLVLRNLLHSIPIRKVIFSNADEAHVAKVFRKLGLEDCFERVICFETLKPIHKSNSTDDGDAIKSAEDGNDLALLESPIICKLFKIAFEEAFKIANINPEKTLLFDDSARNLQTATCMGLHTIVVGSSYRAKGVDYALESIHNIREALPELWETLEKSEGVRYTLSCSKAASSWGLCDLLWSDLIGVRAAKKNPCSCDMDAARLTQWSTSEIIGRDSCTISFSRETFKLYQRTIGDGSCCNLC